MYLMLLVIGILGNKSDLFLEAITIPDENKLLFQLVSAKLNTCIDIFFKEITEKCLSVINTNKDNDDDNDDNKYKRTVKLKESKANKTKKKCC